MKFLGCFFLCLSAFSLWAQSPRRVDFFYTVKERVYKGSVDLQFNLTHNDRDVGAPEIIDFKDYSNPKSLQINAALSNVQWGARNHKDLFKLAFSDEYNMPGDGILKASVYNAYLKTSPRQKGEKIFYSLSDNGEHSYTGIILAFFVLDNDATYADIEKNEIMDEKVLGFGAHVYPILLVSGEMDKSEREEVEANWFVYTLMAEGLNSRLREISVELAEHAQSGNYAGFGEKLEEKGFSPSRNVFKNKGLGEVSPSSSTPNPDQNAFHQASKTNSIDAYDRYLRQYPKGKYVEDAQSRIVDLTPFAVQLEESVQDGFKICTLTFIKGVGNKKPLLSLTNNEDWAIKNGWLSSRQVAFTLPPERATTATFSLGRKDTAIFLSHEIIGGDAAGSFDAGCTEYFPENEDIREKGHRRSNTLLAILLAIPFLAATAYLLKKKYAMK